MVEPIYNSFTSAFAAGQALGRKIKQQKITDNALAKYASGDTAGGIADLTTVDPQAAGLLQEQQRQKTLQARDDSQYAARQAAGQQVASGDIAGAAHTAAAAGDFDLMQGLSQLDERQIKLADEHAGTIASVGIKLLNYPAEQRAAAIQSLKPSLIAKGFKPEEIDAFASDPSDIRLNAAIGQAMTVKDAIAMANQERDDAETLRHHQAIEGQVKTLGNGAVAVDPVTGAVVARNPKTFAPKAGGTSLGHTLPIGSKLVQ